MASTKTTSQSNTQRLTQKLTADVDEAKRRRHELVEQYKKEEKVKVQGSPFYRPYFGNNMPLQINGVGVYVPMDGKTYEIPKTFANLFHQRIARIDSLIQKQGVMSGIVEESYAGEVDLISEM